MLKMYFKPCCCVSAKLPDADATSCTSIPASFAINPRIVNTTSPLKNDVKPTDATHRVVALWNNYRVCIQLNKDK